MHALSSFPLLFEEKGVRGDELLKIKLARDGLFKKRNSPAKSRTVAQFQKCMDKQPVFS
jgi:hypothetical protein